MWLFLFLSGSKFWRSTRKIRVISLSDYSSFKGKKKFVHLSQVSDSDSDFETTISPKRQCLDVTTECNADAKSMERVVNRMDAIEKSMKQSISQIEDVDRLKKSISALETSNAKLSDEKRPVERSLEEFKNSLSCIVCKCLAKFPWMVTPCCQLMFSDCFLCFSVRASNIDGSAAPSFTGKNSSIPTNSILQTLSASFLGPGGGSTIRLQSHHPEH